MARKWEFRKKEGGRCTHPQTEVHPALEVDSNRRAHLHVGNHIAGVEAIIQQSR
jgi:hypothetical protein